jgi:hypothetical protein
MDWTQCLTIIGTTLGATSVLFFITRKDIQLMDDRMTKSMEMMDKNHREDMQRMDEKMNRMDSKWKDLFGLFLELKSK